jgi:hypothetical protein
MVGNLKISMITVTRREILSPFFRLKEEIALEATPVFTGSLRRIHRQTMKHFYLT